MANVNAKVTGGDLKEITGVSTVGELKTKMGLSTNHSALVNGKEASDSTQLNDYDSVRFAPQVKGA